MVCLMASAVPDAWFATALTVTALADGEPGVEKAAESTLMTRRIVMFRSSLIWFVPICVASVVGGYSGCSFTTINAAPGPTTALSDGASAQSALGSREKIADSGDFKVTYAPAKKLSEIAEAVNEMKALSDLIPDLNANFALAEDLLTVFKECDGQANASYDPKERKITICYEFIQYLAGGFSKVYEKDEDGAESLVNAMTFFFFHELGHALFHIDGIPVGARQEDAATIVLSKRYFERRRTLPDRIRSVPIASAQRA